MKTYATATANSRGLKIPLSLRESEPYQPLRLTPLHTAGGRLASRSILLCPALVPAKETRPRQRPRALVPTEPETKSLFRRVLDEHCDEPANDLVDPVLKPWFLRRILHCDCSFGFG